MNIFEAPHDKEPVPEGFQAVTITLDAAMQSTLEWQEAKEAAERYVAQGKKLFIELDFGLFDRLTFPLAHETQMQSLHLSIQHFSTTFWPSFAKEIVGVSLYRGSVDEALTGSDYLALLAGQLPDEAVPFLLLEAKHPRQSTYAKERFTHFTLAVKGGGGPVQEFAWGQGIGPKGYIGRALPQETAPKISPVALCLPSENTPVLQKAMEIMSQRFTHYRMIPEAHLTAEWEGLDYLIVDPDTLTPLTRRKLMGFCAAGGTVVSLGNEVGMPSEVPFKEGDFQKS